MENDEQKRDVGEPNEKLFVGGLAWAATEEDLTQAFEPYGIVEAVVVRYNDTGRSKGFGFVRFNSVEEAQKALEEMDEKEIAGRKVSLSFARARADERPSGDQPAE